MCRDAENLSTGGTRKDKLSDHAVKWINRSKKTQRQSDSDWKSSRHYDNNKWGTVTKYTTLTMQHKQLMADQPQMLPKHARTHTHTHARTHTHTRLTALFLGLPKWAGTRKVKPIWILLKQERVSGSGISWAICKSAPRSRQITMPAPYHSVFYMPDALPATQPTASKHWRQKHWKQYCR